VQAGAVLLVTGLFGADEYFHAVDRQNRTGLPHEVGPLTLRENVFRFPGGDETVFSSGLKTTVYAELFFPMARIGWRRLSEKEKFSSRRCHWN
jgi:hypothetical protein